MRVRPSPRRRSRSTLWAAAIVVGVGSPLAASAVTLAANSGPASHAAAPSGAARTAAAPSGAPATVSCTVSQLVTLGGRYGNVTAAAANGTFVGIADNSAGVPQPVLWRAGHPELLRTGLVNSVPSGINSHGDVVGNSSSGENTVGWVWTGHRATLLRGAGALSAVPAAISDSGVIAGALEPAEGLPNEGGSSPGTQENEQAAMWRSAASAPVKLAPLPGDQGANAFAVSPDGRAGGVSEGARFRAVIWDGAGRPHQLAGLGGGYAAVRAFGPGGVAVGDAVAADGTDHPVRWDAAGRITDLGLPAGSRTAQATGVLPSGTVMGTAQMPAPGGGVVTQAVRWTQAGHPQLLAGREGLEQTAVASAASAQTAGGYLADAKGGRHPVMWRCGR